MTWRAVDQDAVASQEPLDAFVLQRVEENTRAAWDARTRRWGVSWPVDERPQIGCHLKIAWMLGLHLISDGVDEITCVVRGIVADANVVASIGFLGRHGVVYGQEQTLTPGAQTVTLTVDCSGYAENIVILLFFLRSETGTVVYSSGDITGDRFRWLSVELPAGHGIVWSANERYVLHVLVPAAGGPGPMYDETPYSARTVLHNPVAADPNFFWAWPSVEPVSRLESGNYRIQLSRLGRLELKGFSVFESSTVPAASAVGALRPGMRPAAPAMSRIYGLEHRIARKRTRAQWSGLSCDPLTLDAHGSILCQWGVLREITTSYQTFSMALIGDTDNDQYTTGPDSSPVTKSRTKLRVAVVLCFPFVGREVEFLGDLRFDLRSWNGTAWDGSILQFDEEENWLTRYAAASRFFPIFQDDTLAQTLGFGIEETFSWHTLRGAWPSFDGIVVREFLYDDTIPATKRRLRIQVKARSSTALNGREIVSSGGPLGRSCGVYIPAWGVWTTEGT